MHGVKQTQMKFIIVKDAFKKRRFFTVSSFSRWLFPLCYSKILVKKRIVTPFDRKKGRVKNCCCFV